MSSFNAVLFLYFDGKSLGSGEDQEASLSPIKLVFVDMGRCRQLSSLW